MAACSAQWMERLSAFFDGECAKDERAHVQRHLEACAQCRGASGAMQGLSAGMKRLGARPVSPPERLSSPPPRRRWKLKSVGALAAAALVAFGVHLGGVFQPGLGDALANDLERQHVQAFTRKTPCEFESSDPDAVRRWVKENTGFDVEVPELTGATLLGARRCKLSGQLAVSLLYRQGEHALTVFLPGPGTSAAKAAARFAERGGRCEDGAHGEKICAGGPSGTALAVSDLPPESLLSLMAQLPR